MPDLDQAFFAKFRFGTVRKTPYDGVNVWVALTQAPEVNQPEGEVEIYFDAPVFWGCCPEGDEDYLITLHAETKAFLDSLEIDWVETGKPTLEFAKKFFPDTWAAEGVTERSEIPTRKTLFGGRKMMTLAEYRKRRWAKN
jgi:hypothetical protein